MISFRRGWKCQYCGRAWKSASSYAGVRCPDCGGTRIKAVMARPSDVTAERPNGDAQLQQGLELLRAAQTRDK